MEPSTGEPFHCPVEGCGSKFKRKEHLVRHSKSHSSSRPFTCEICGKSFVRSDVLRRHVRQHEEKELNPPAPTQGACDLCHARKSRCDGSTPCGACVHRGLHCTRNRIVSRNRLPKTFQDEQSESSADEQETLSTGNALGTAPPIPPPAVSTDTDPHNCHTCPSSTRGADQSSYAVLQSIFSPDTLHHAWQSFDSPKPTDPAVSTTPATSVRPNPLPEVQSTPQRWCPITGMSLEEGPSTQSSYEHSNTLTVATPLIPTLQPPERSAFGTQQTSTMREDLAPPPPNNDPPQFFETKGANAYTAAYFTNFHSQWPILHPPSFSIFGWGPELIWSIVMLGARFTYSENGKVLSEAINEELLDIFEPEGDGAGPRAEAQQTIFARQAIRNSERWNALISLQAGVLNVIYAIYFGDEQHIARARRVMHHVGSAMCDVGAFDPGRIAGMAQEEPGEREGELKREQWRRLAHTCHDIQRFFAKHTDKELGDSMERKLSFRRTWKEAETWEPLSDDHWRNGNYGG